MYAHADIQSVALPSYTDVVHFILHFLVFFSSACFLRLYVGVDFGQPINIVCPSVQFLRLLLKFVSLEYN